MKSVLVIFFQRCLLTLALSTEDEIEIPFDFNGNGVAWLNSSFRVVSYITGAFVNVVGDSPHTSTLVVNPSTWQHAVDITYVSSDNGDSLIVQNDDLALSVQDVTISTPDWSQPTYITFIYYQGAHNGSVTFDNVEFYNYRAIGSLATIANWADNAKLDSLLWNNVVFDGAQFITYVNASDDGGVWKYGYILDGTNWKTATLDAVSVQNSDFYTFLRAQQVNKLNIKDLTMYNFNVSAGRLMYLSEVDDVVINGMYFNNSNSDSASMSLIKNAIEFGQVDDLQMLNVEFHSVDMLFQTEWIFFVYFQEVSSVLVHNLKIHDSELEECIYVMYASSCDEIDISDWSIVNTELEVSRSVLKIEAESLVPYCSLDNFSIQDSEIETSSANYAMLAFFCDSLSISNLLFANNQIELDSNLISTFGEATSLQIDGFYVKDLYVDKDTDATMDSSYLTLGQNFVTVNVTDLHIDNITFGIAGDVLTIVCNGADSIQLESVTISGVSTGQAAVAVSDCAGSSVTFRNVAITSDTDKIGFGLHFINVGNGSFEDIRINLDGIENDAIWGQNCQECQIKNATFENGEVDQLMYWKFYQSSFFDGRDALYIGRCRFADSIIQTNYGFEFAVSESSLDFEFTIENSVFSNNVKSGDSTANGGFIYFGWTETTAGTSKLYINNCEFVNNTNFMALIAAGDGSKVDIIITNSVFYMNEGGVVLATRRRQRNLLNVYETRVMNGFFVQSQQSSISIYNSTFVGNNNFRSTFVETGNDFTSSSVTCTNCVFNVSFEDSPTSTFPAFQTTFQPVFDTSTTTSTFETEETEETEAVATSTELTVSEMYQTQTRAPQTNTMATGAADGTDVSAGDAEVGPDGSDSKSDDFGANVVLTVVLAVVVVLLACFSVSVFVWKRRQAKKKESATKNGIMNSNEKHTQLALVRRSSNSRTNNRNDIASDADSMAVPMKTGSSGGEALQLDSNEVNGMEGSELAQDEGEEGVNMQDAINIFGATNSTKYSDVPTDELVADEQDGLEVTGRKEEKKMFEML